MHDFAFFCSIHLGSVHNKKTNRINAVNHTSKVNDCFIDLWSSIYYANCTLNALCLNMSMWLNLAHDSPEIIFANVCAELCWVDGSFLSWCNHQWKSIVRTKRAKYVIKLCNCIEMMYRRLDKQFFLNYNSLPHIAYKIHVTHDCHRKWKKQLNGKFWISFSTIAFSFLSNDLHLNKSKKKSFLFSNLVSLHFFSGAGHIHHTISFQSLDEL